MKMIFLRRKFAILLVMLSRSMRGAVLALAVAALAFMAYRLAVYSSPAQKQARWVKATEQEIQALQVTIDSLDDAAKRCLADPSIVRFVKRIRHCDSLGFASGTSLHLVRPYYRKIDSLRRELNRSKSASKR